jgi:lipid II:glycine glycyltransferase (peptidoglycan interpeptide bridge formation enzyme)
MATVAERVSVVEVQVINLDEKLDNIKVDVKELHNCLDRTGESLSKTLADMRTEATNQHNELACKIKDLEKQKQKLMTYGMIGLAFIAGLGWTGQLNIMTITKFFGL